MLPKQEKKIKTHKSVVNQAQLGSSLLQSLLQLQSDCLGLESTERSTRLDAYNGFFPYIQRLGWNQSLSLSPSPPTMQLAWASLQYRSLREVRLPTWWLAFSSVSSDQSRNCNTLCDAALVLFLKHPEAFYWSKVSHRASPDSSGGAILRDYCILHKNFLL